MPLHWWRRIAPAVLLVVAFLTSACIVPVGSHETVNAWTHQDTGIDWLHGQGLSGRGVRIAVLDSGFDPDHKLLAHLVDGRSANGEVVEYRDFIKGTSGIKAASDSDGHGSHILSIVGGRPFDSLATPEVPRGVAPHAAFIVARVCETEGCMHLREAIDWSVASGADVITMSLGAEHDQPHLDGAVPTEDVQIGISAAVDAGVLVVAAAGNDGQGASDVHFPGNLRDVISVGSINRDGQVSSFSSWGDPEQNRCRHEALPALFGRCFPHQKPELVAPGEGILGAARQGIGFGDGTSQATPFVSGILALLIEAHGVPEDRSDVLEWKRVVADTALRLGDTRHHDASGYGIVNGRGAHEALGR